MEITIEELLDYLQCPLKYRNRYVDQIEEVVRKVNSFHQRVNEYTLQDMFDKEVKKVAYHIFNYIQDNKYPSEYLLRQKWGKIWCKDKTIEDTMFESTGEWGMSAAKHLEKQGLRAIQNMHPKFKENSGYPLLVGKRVKLDIGKHTLYVTLDLVREIVIDTKPVIELAQFNTGVRTKKQINYKPHKIHIQHDLQVTAASLALEQLIGRREDRIVYYDIINNEEYETGRSERDFKRLENILDQAERAIQAEVFYPVMNEKCFDCPFQMNCKHGKW